MANNISTFLANKLLDHVLGGTAYSAPASVYLALFTVAPNVGGTGGTEVTGGSYARKTVANNSTSFPAASAHAKANGASFDYPFATAGWGTVVAVGIYDAVSAGNLLMVGTLTAPRTIATDDAFTFRVADLTWSLV